eukprot:4417385-Pleurochrysis_carterae.AAC.9
MNAAMTASSERQNGHYCRRGMHAAEVGDRCDTECCRNEDRARPASDTKCAERDTRPPALVQPHGHARTQSHPHTPIRTRPTHPARHRRCPVLSHSLALQQTRSQANTAKSVIGKRPTEREVSGDDGCTQLRRYHNHRNRSLEQAESAVRQRTERKTSRCERGRRNEGNRGTDPEREKNCRLFCPDGVHNAYPRGRDARRSLFYSVRASKRGDRISRFGDVACYSMMSSSSSSANCVADCAASR